MTAANPTKYELWPQGGLVRVEDTHSAASHPAVVNFCLILLNQLIVEIFLHNVRPYFGGLRDAD